MIFQIDTFNIKARLDALFLGFFLNGLQILLICWYNRPRLVKRWMNDDDDDDDDDGPSKGVHLKSQSDKSVYQLLKMT